MTSESNPRTARRIRSAFDQTMLDSVVPGSLIVGLIYAVLTPIYVIRPPAAGAGILIACAIGTATVLIALGLRWRRRPPESRHAQRLGALVLGAVLFNNTLFVVLFPEPEFAGTLAAVLLAAGWFFLTQPWFAAFVVATAAAFGVCVLRGDPQANWFGPLMLLLANGGLAVVIHFSRARSVRRFELLRIENEARAREQQQAADTLQRARKLESLALMAGGIAHDFNNLLTVIVGNASLMLADTTPGDAAAGPLQDVIDAGSRATTLTEQLLVYTGHGFQQRESVNLSAITSRLQDQIARVVPLTARLQFDLAENIPLVAVDPKQLQQVLMNLAQNAGQAFEDRGEHIWIRTGVANLTASDLEDFEPATGHEPGRYAYVEVEDDGCGIEPGVLERIFDPFFTTRHNGHGLGLAAVLGIVHGHGGGVRVTSKPGAGTRVQVFFPAPGNAVSHRHAEYGPAATPARRGTALIIDDERLVRRIAAAALRRLGWKVIEAASGRDGIEALRRSRDLVRFCLLDMTMPGLGGEATLKGLRKLNPQLPVLLTSGHNQQSVVHLVESGQALFLEKPYRLERMSAALQELLGANPETGPAATSDHSDAHRNPASDLVH